MTSHSNVDNNNNNNNNNNDKNNYHNFIVKVRYLLLTPFYNKKASDTPLHLSTIPEWGYVK